MISLIGNILGLLNKLFGLIGGWIKYRAGKKAERLKQAERLNDQYLEANKARSLLDSDPSYRKRMYDKYRRKDG